MHDTAKGEVRITAPIAGFVTGAKAKLGPGAKVTGLAAQDRILGQGVVPSQNAPTGQRIPLGGLNVLVDDATGRAPYVMGTPSCVPVGK